MTSPSRSIARSVPASTFGVTVRSGTRNSVNRRGPCSRHNTTIAVHFSPIRSGITRDGHARSNMSGSSGVIARA